MPVLSLTDRLRSSSRLLLVVAVLLIPSLIAAGSFAVTIGGQVDFAEYERAGVRVVAPAVQALAESAAGRTLDLTKLRAAVQDHPQLDAGKAMRRVDDAPAGPAQLAALAGMVTAVGDSSKLILDPDLDSFYVMDALVVQLPRALMVIGTPRAGIGDAVAASRAVQSGTLALTAAELQSHIGTAVEQTAMRSLGEELEPVLGLSRQLSSLGGLVGSSLQQAPTQEPSARAGAADATGIAATTLAKQLDVLLERRASALALRRNTTLVLTLGGLLIAVWIASAVIWRTREDVHLTLAGVAAISDGDLQERALPHGSDEFGDIGRAVLGARQRLARLLFRDPLTGLPNRPLFVDRLERALTDPALPCVTVLFLDLDRFKAVNDRLGHAAGDELLRAAAERIQLCTRPEDTAARFGGDEFAVVLPGQDEACGRTVADRIVRALHEPFTVTGGRVHIGVAIGIAEARHGVSADELLAEADVGLYGAKRNGGGQARVYDPVLRAEHLHRLQRDADLQAALPGG
jgi:diguanylate cyclase (GGDEF)-like protein